MDQPVLHGHADQAPAWAGRRASIARSAYMVTMPERAEIFAHEAEIRALCADMLDPNVFLGADFLLSACRHFPEAATPDFLLVWAGGQPGEPRHLVGLLPVARRRAGSGGLIRSWTHPFAPLGGPVLHKDHAEPALTALLGHLAREHPQASALCLNHLSLEGETGDVLRKVTGQLSLKTDVLTQSPRAILTLPPLATTDEHAQGRTRRRQRRRLSEQGALGFRLIEDYEDVRAAFERFLALEAGGWKGARGTALILDPAIVNFSRSMVWSAAGHGGVWIGELLLDDQIIASIVILVAGDRAFLWKMAHDENFQAFSPGALLLLDLNAWLIADNRLRLIDSCTEAGHPIVDRIWSERMMVADMTVALDPLRAPAYLSTLARERLRRDMRQRIKRIYHRLRSYAVAS